MFSCYVSIFFFNDTATTEIYTLSLHDALPIFGDDGRVKKKATITVLQNGVLIQDHSEVFGTTTNEPVFPTYEKHGKGPIKLQDHGNPVRFRNVWVREL